MRFRSKGFHPEKLEEGHPSATASQEKLPGFNQQNLRDARIQMIGCGGIGGSILDHLVRKGCGRVDVYDGDSVEIGNLGRQKFFPSDVGQNKAICGARNAIRHASWPTEIVAHPMWFEDATRRGLVGGASAAIVGPDRDSTRVFCSKYFYKMCPVISVGIGTRAEHGYVFVQKPGATCFACIFPGAITDQRTPCPGTPAMIDILLVIAGLVLTALDSLLMPGRAINWNYWDIYPSGAIPTQPLMIERRKDCPICGKFN
ncbi:MAG: ThiF family adenylyltransferase [Kiritimatiellae bacterium]|nr:ThiF family adenylyltransferase [Kiritimatiellia bacterium]